MSKAQIETMIYCIGDLVEILGHSSSQQDKSKYGLVIKVEMTSLGFSYSISTSIDVCNSWHISLIQYKNDV